MFLVVLGALNYKALFSVLPWRGDEGHHIFWTLGLWYMMNKKGIVMGLLFLLFLFEGWRKSPQIIFSAVFLVAIIVFVISLDQIDYHFVLRYPFISKWFSMGLVYLASLFGGLFSEAAYRILPFL